MMMSSLVFADKIIIPVVKTLEKKIHFPFGLSLFVIAEAVEEKYSCNENQQKLSSL
jgi:hypothetical protein